MADNAYINQQEAVRNIQRQLDSIGRFLKSIPRVLPDGIYGDTTAEAVRALQKHLNLPVTGSMDYETFQKMVELERDLNQMLQSIPIRPFHRSLHNQCISPGEAFDLIYILQIMLNTLGIAYDSIGHQLPLSGIYDDATQEAVKKFQAVNALPSDAVINQPTWNALAMAYNKYVDSE